MVKFDCDPGYVLMGERRRWCYESGDWNWAENGDADKANDCALSRLFMLQGVVGGV